MYLMGIWKMIEIYFLVFKDFLCMWSLYEFKKLRFLSSFLDGFICFLMVIEDLLQVCGEKELKRIVLVVFMLFFLVGIYLKFGVFICEFSWVFDVIQYVSSLEDLEFRWFEERCRYVFKRNQEIDVLVVEVELLVFVGVDDRFVCDCRNFLFYLESGVVIIL